MAMKCCFTSTETIGLLGMRAQDSHLDFHTAPEVADKAAPASNVALRQQRP